MPHNDVYLAAARAYVEAQGKFPEPHWGYHEGREHSLANDLRFRAAVDAVLEWSRRVREVGPHGLG